ncbi:hypothetical protein CYLTODRAFT_228942 [Cylindrobasidium torrendii FP15055 ss-10]|uniref:Uncharacterized protein n=1 Tax=Cylindrobasidium torrendii FP15055 ss-10 TaxID=1314674 RepID=A0A0D7BG11_9AGAR|nr:hypothetical protein CYLTODRAFT_228942 [Cylindrobasidium torrendii FP15055 ss-10]
MSTFQPSPGDRPTNVHPDMYSSEYGYRGLSEAEALRESQSRNVHLRQELGKAQLEIQQLTQELGMLKAKWIAHTCSTSAKTSTPEQPASGQPNDLQRLKMALIYANLWFNQSKYGGITERIVDESLARDVDVSAAGRPSLTVDRRAILLVTKSLFETYAGSDELTAQLVGGLISSAVRPFLSTGIF